MASVLFLLLFLLPPPLILFIFLLSIRLRPAEPGSFAVLHPHTRDGGGGEKVLWCAIRALLPLRSSSSPPITIYTGDEVLPNTESSLFLRSHRLFGVTLPPSSLDFVHLRATVRLGDAALYPVATVLLQLLGGALVGLEALWRYKPAILIDTAGYAGSYPFARLLGIRVIAYTHYPIVSEGMVKRVEEGKQMYNNCDRWRSSRALQMGKVAYYRVLQAVYGYCCRCADIQMANSSWTARNLRRICKSKPTIVFPPCDTEKLQALPLMREGWNPDTGVLKFISVAQFRPEKAHMIQLEAFCDARMSAQKSGDASRLSRRMLNARLQFVGSCRNEGDEERLAALRRVAEERGVLSQIDFFLSIPYDELIALLGEATAGVHSMIDEHFGISVVEYMAAGVIPIAHDSAGPKEDIVGAANKAGEVVGHLATSQEEFSEAMTAVSELLTDAERGKYKPAAIGRYNRTLNKMAKAGRKYAAKFSVKAFEDDFRSQVAAIIV